MCIYFTDRLDLTYLGEEHIIPAAIGGKKKLEKGVVSDQFNNNLSTLELDFFRNSIYGTPRLFWGPGKRGSLNESKATKSKIHILKHDDGSLSLAYLKLGRQIIIPQVSLNVVTGEFLVGLQNSEQINYEAKIRDFGHTIENWADQKIRIIRDSKVPRDIILIGAEKGVEDHYNCFFAISENAEFSPNQSLFDVLLKGLQMEIANPKVQNDRPISTLQSKFNEDFYRVFGKIAFNFLAESQGSEFVLSSVFDPIRNWIIYGGDNHFVYEENVNIKLEKLLMITDPQNFHLILLSSANKMLIACISLYGMPEILVRLSDNYLGEKVLDGLVCNWREAKEERLMSFLSKKTNNGNADDK